MNENLRILHKKIEHLVRMQADVAHSVSKMSIPLQKIQCGGIDSLTLDERETISAFTKRFSDYQEQLGKTMRSVAIEEESPVNPFGAILSLMEKLEILESSSKWKDIRELRNQAGHEYEDDVNELFQILSGMIEGTSYLSDVQARLQEFVAQNYKPLLSEPEIKFASPKC